MYIYKLTTNIFVGLTKQFNMLTLPFRLGIFSSVYLALQPPESCYLEMGLELEYGDEDIGHNMKPSTVSLLVHFT